METKQYPIQSKRTCHKCGKFLLLIKEEIEDVEDQQFPVTTSTYICPDAECQQDSDKKNEQQKQRVDEQRKKKQQRIDSLKKKKVE